MFIPCWYPAPLMLQNIDKSVLFVQNNSQTLYH